MLRTLRNWVSSPAIVKNRNDQRRRRLRVEPLETRRLLAVLTVDNSDLVACGAGGDSLHCEIHEAVEAASPGDQIKVEAGTYEPFEVDKDNLTIHEANANSNPVVDATGEEFGVVISANNVTVRGLEARNAITTLDSSGFQVNGSNNTLIGNVATDSYLGIAVGGFFGLPPSNGNRLIGNTARGNEFGIGLAFGSDNQITNNTASQNSSAGFIDLFTVGNTYVGNTAEGNARFGFLLDTTVDTRLTANRAKDNLIGFRDFGSVGVAFTANHAEGNGEDGFQFLFSSNLTAIGNTSSNNARDGIRLAGVQNSTFTGNSAQDNGRHGFFLGALGGNNGNVFTGNKARGNGEYGILVDPDSLDNVFRGMSCKGNGLDGSNLDDIC